MSDSNTAEQKTSEQKTAEQTAAEQKPLDPKNAKLLAARRTPLALLSLAYDELSGRLYGAGLDGHLYQVDLANLGERAEAVEKAFEKTEGDAKSASRSQDQKGEKPAAERRWKLHDNYVSSMLLNGSILATASYDRTIAWWDLANGNRIRSVEAHAGWVRQLTSIAGGRWIASVGDDMTAKLWNVESGECDRVFAGHASRTPQGFATALYAIASSPGGEWLAAADRTGACLIWETMTGRVVGQFAAADFYTYDVAKRARSIGGVRALRFSPDGRQLAVAGIGQVTNVDGFVGPCRVELWDWQASRREYVGQAKHQAIQNAIAFGPENWLITTGGGDGGGNLAFWKTNEPAPIHIAKPEGHLHGLAVRGDGREIYLAGHGGFQVWSV